MAGDLKRSFLGLATLTAVGLATAAEPPLADPTQPPSGITAADGSFVGAAGFGLTSVFLPVRGRPVAVIDGQVVPLGGSVRGARLTFVSERQAVLEGPGGIERLYLTPDVDKKTTARRAGNRLHKD